MTDRSDVLDPGQANIQQRYLINNNNNNTTTTKSHHPSSGTYLLLTAWGSWLLVWLPTLLSDILVTSLSSSPSLDVSSALDAW